ncbi:MAG: hypothetical protein HC843_11030 [Sphingomonadales bacterium]|nr:hypothetical protein [Sphingomonadales bacterium]
MMLGAIYTGLSGLNAFSRGLQTISNNVANLNSPGFKATSTRFGDVSNFGGGGLTFFRGVDEAQVGNGVRLALPARISRKAICANLRVIWTLPFKVAVFWCY